MSNYECIEIISSDEEKESLQNAISEKNEEKNCHKKEPVQSVKKISVPKDENKTVKKRIAPTLISHQASSTNRALSPVASTSCESQPSCSPNSRLFEQYIILCKKKDNCMEMDKIIERLFKSYKKANSLYKESLEFKELLSRQLEVGAHPLFKIYPSIKLILDELKFHKKNKEKGYAIKTETVSNNTSLEEKEKVNDTNGTEVSEVDKKEVKEDCEEVIEDSDADSLCGFDDSRRRNIRKLEKVLRKLHKAIAKLEMATVKWEKDSDSAYIRMDRYRQRFTKVYEKICELRKKAPDADRPIKRKISFIGSGYPDIDKCIEKMYNRTRKFPDFRDILDLVKEVKKNENISSDNLYKIAEKVFKEFGTLLKIIRQRDDYDIMCSYIPNMIDPAAENEELRHKLDANYKQFKKKEEEVINSFAEKEIKSGLKPEAVDGSGDEQEDDDDDDDDDGSDGEEKKEEDEDDLIACGMGLDESEIEDDSFSKNEENCVEFIGKKRTSSTSFGDVDDDGDHRCVPSRKKRCTSLEPDIITDSLTSSEKGSDDLQVTDKKMQDSGCCVDGSSDYIRNGEKNVCVTSDEKTTVKSEKRKTFILTADELMSNTIINMLNDNDFTNETICLHNDSISKTPEQIEKNPEKGSLRVVGNFDNVNGDKETKETNIVIKDDDLLEISQNLEKKFETSFLDIFDHKKSSIINNDLLKSGDNIVRGSDDSVNICNDGDPCRVKEIKIDSDVKNLVGQEEDPSNEIDVVYCGKSEDDDVRIITPQKKIKRSQSSVDVDSDVSLLKIVNNITVSYLQPTLPDLVKPLATSSPKKKQPVIIEKTNIQKPKSKSTLLKQLVIPQVMNEHGAGSSKSSGGSSVYKQTARVIGDSGNAEYLSKDNANKVLRMASTKVFTKGIKNTKNVNCDEVITID